MATFIKLIIRNKKLGGARIAALIVVALFGLVWLLLLRADDPGQVGMPVFSIDGGVFTTRQTVTVSCGTPGATIRYTTNGNDPSETDRPIANGGTLLIDRTKTLKARAFKSGLTPSEVKSAEFWVTGAIAAGYYHSLAVRSDGLLWAWGSNESGQIGDGSTTDHIIPVPVSGLGEVVAVAAREVNSFAVNADGIVWSWGANWDGQLGDGTTQRLSPVAVTGLTNVVAVSAGLVHAAALTAEGTVWAWGNNAYGQLGDGTLNASAVPVTVGGLSNVVAVAAGDLHNLALRADGTVWAWGLNAAGQLGDGSTVNRAQPVPVNGLTDVVAVAGGGAFTLALRSDGTVWTWGENTYGQLGDGTTEDSTVPVQVTGLTDIVAIEGGQDHAIAVRSDGTVWTWGANADGQLGDGTTDDSSVPVQVGGLSDVIAVAGGFNFSLALKTDGTVWSWGSNLYGQLGNGSALRSGWPLTQDDLSGVLTIAAGEYHNLAATADGIVWSWGANWDGQLGDGTTDTSARPVAVNGLVNPAALAAGYYDTPDLHHSLALLSDGTVSAWGNNERGQLGTGTTHNSTLPVPVNGLTDVAAVAGGGAFTLALRSDGTVWTWGENTYGQLGDGTTEDSTVPVQVTGLTDIVAIEGGQDHAIAVRSDGTVWTWGANADGQLGDGTTDDSSVPVQVGGLSDVIAVAGGFNFSLALKTDGTVWSWGANWAGQLGDGTATQRLSPVAVTGLTNVVAVSAKLLHALAIKQDGSLWGWGFSGDGALCTGQRIDGSGGSSPPAQAIGLTNVIAVATGLHHSLILKSDGAVWVCGGNEFGQLGRALFTETSTVPVQVAQLRLVWWDDPDGDGVPTWREIEEGTDPDVPFTDPNGDADGDGLPNWWEWQHGLDPLDPSDAASDLDGDGFSNLVEYLAGTHPRDATLFPKSLLTIPNAWAIYTATNIVEVTAHVRSTNAFVNVLAAEFFLDSTNNVVAGTGIPMFAEDGVFNSTNEVAKATFNPTFPAGERHELFIHALGQDGQWSDWKKAIINPTVEDILAKIETNYSAFADLQFDVIITERLGGVATWTNSSVVKMKGPYKFRTERAGGFVSIQNANRTWWHHDGLGIGGRIESGVGGDFSSTNNLSADFFWDIPRTLILSSASLSNSVNSATMDMILTANPGQLWQTLYCTADYTKGIVTQLEERNDEVVIRSEFLAPVELLPSAWLFTTHRHVLEFTSGEVMTVESVMTNIQANQGLSDAIFDIPTE